MGGAPFGKPAFLNKFVLSAYIKIPSAVSCNHRDSQFSQSPARSMWNGFLNSPINFLPGEEFFLALLELTPSRNTDWECFYGLLEKVSF